MRARTFWSKRELRWRVLSLFQDDPKITIRAVAEKMSVSETTANRLVKFCKETFMLPRIPKRKWTAELIQEVVDYNRREEKRRTEVMRYGECPNCGETGKDALQYRKLVDRGYWIFYKVCHKCRAQFDLWIKEDSNLYVVEDIGLFDALRMEFEEDIKLAKNIIKKLEKGEHVPRDQLNMLVEWAEKYSHLR